MATVTDEPQVPAEAAANVAPPDLYEIVRGQFVETPTMSVYALRTANRLEKVLNRFLDANDIGIVGVEEIYRIPVPGDPERARRPDAAFLSYERWPKDRPVPEDDAAWDVVPDLAVEVVSPSDKAEDVLEKVDEYFGAGCRLVWVVYPRRRLVYVYESPTQLRVLTRADTLDGGAVLPGFAVPLADILQAPPPPPA